MLAVIHTDGASSGNPGPSGIGAVVSISGRKHELAEFIGSATNNIAEYTSIIRALELAQELGATRIEAFMDSELVVKQMRGEYKVKNAGLRPLFEKASALASSFSSFAIAHVPREQNKEADKLSKKGVEAGSKPGAKPAAPAQGQGNLPF